MKQLKVTVGKKGSHDTQALDSVDTELKEVLGRLKKKGLNPAQMCQKLLEHQVTAPSIDGWSYELVVNLCKKFKL